MSRRFVFVAVIGALIISMHPGFARQHLGRCGGNTDTPPYPGTWGQGIAKTQAAALTAAQQDFNQELAKATAALTQWADNLVCLLRCPHKLILDIKHENYKETPVNKIEYSATKRGYIADAFEDSSITVQCFPIKVKEMQE
jgi:hypothetical protein